MKVLASVSCGLCLATGAVYFTLPIFDFDEGIRRSVAFLALALLVVAVGSTWAYVRSDTTKIGLLTENILGRVVVPPQPRSSPALARRCRLDEQSRDSRIDRGPSSSSKYRTR